MFDVASTEIGDSIIIKEEIIGNMRQNIQDKVGPLLSLFKLPSSLCIRRNQSNTGYGIWTKEDIPSGMRFGPYEGIVVASPLNLRNIGYCWQIQRESGEIAFVDATDGNQSNWLRYVNFTSVKEQHNLIVLHYQGEMYYQSYKTIPANTELLIWYGNNIKDKSTTRKEGSKKIDNCLASSSLSICSEMQEKQDMESNEENLNKNDSIKYKCNACNKGFGSSYKLNSHQRFHSNERKFVCNTCTYRFESNHSLQKHKSTHSDQRPFNCSTCQKQYKSKSSLQRHERVHTGLRPYKCDVCHKQFTWRYNLQKHKLIHIKTKFRILRKKNKKLKIVLERCDSRRKILNINIGQRSTNICECDVCHKEFSIKYIKIHKRMHTGENPYNCDTCHKPFKDKSNCNTHKRKHTKERRFSCNFCNKQFIWSGDLKKHKRIHTGEKPYGCDICHKKFSQCITLNIHKRVHTGMKPYECNLCSQKFADSSNLRAHEKRRHTIK